MEKYNNVSYSRYPYINVRSSYKKAPIINSPYINYPYKKKVSTINSPYKKKVSTINSPYMNSPNKKKKKYNLKK
jgi:hypothetical protein